MFKNTGQSLKLKAPILPDCKPVPPNEEEISKGKVPDENTWVYTIFECIELKLKEGVSHLTRYLNTYDKLKNAVDLDPIKWIDSEIADRFDSGELTVYDIKQYISNN